MPQNSTRGFYSREPGNNIPSIGSSWFLGIGINKYKDFPNLNNAVKDVKDVQQILQDRYQLDHSFILLDGDATRSNVIRKLEDIERSVQPADKLLIYFSGHGHLSFSRRGYWILHDADKGYTDGYFSNSRLKEYIADIRARHILLFSDACFSGALFLPGVGVMRGDVFDVEEKLEKWPSRYAVCSGRHDEKVYDGPPGGNSPFAKSLLEVLRTNQKSSLRASRIAEEIIDRTSEIYPHPVPQNGPLFEAGDQGGQYIFRLKGEQMDPQVISPSGEINHEFKLHKRKPKHFPLKKYSSIFIGSLITILILIIGFWLSSRNQPLSRDNTYVDEFPKKMNITLGGELYPIIQFRKGGLNWMAKNLNLNIGSSKCYKDTLNYLNNCDKYGRLYTWEAAKIACDSLGEGWRLPSEKEWCNLAAHYGGWNKCDEVENRYDTKMAFRNHRDGGISEFEGTLGGKFAVKDNVGFTLIDEYGYYWTSTSSEKYRAWVYIFDTVDDNLVGNENALKASFRSCRCVKE